MKLVIGLAVFALALAGILAVGGALLFFEMRREDRDAAIRREMEL